MDRYAILVDAGYLLSGMGFVTTGSSDRATFDIELDAMLDLLHRRAREHCALDLLRLYWYDAATERRLTPMHKELAEHDNVKVRLGRLGMSGQKGVDALLLRDFLTLAQNKAVDTIYLVSGDEDLVEGVMAAQEHGVLVHLITVQSDEHRNFSAALQREVDGWLQLSPEELAPLVKPASSASGAGTQNLMSDAFGKELGRQFGTELAAEIDKDALRELALEYPELPRDIDRQLLRYASRMLGGELEQATKRSLRAGFWETVNDLVPALTADPPASASSTQP
jgi:uncharacterized LabA/DUF88 family protein